MQHKSAWAKVSGLGLILLGLLTACSSDPTAAGIIVSVTITPHRDTISVGETSIALSAVAKNANGDVVPDAAITWKSDQPFLVSVDSLSGTVKGIGLGAAAITAQVGPVKDTAQVFVVAPIALSLGLDTIALAPGDTFSILATAAARAGTQPTLTYGGGDAAIATVNAQSGLITAVAPGLTAYRVFADTFSASGVIAVLTVPDTASDGAITMKVSGSVTRTTNLAAKGYNYPTLDNTHAFQLAALTPDTTQDHFTLTLMETISGVLSRPIGVLPSSGVSDPVCHPPGTWAFYRHALLGIRALSQSGTFTITTAAPLTGGLKVSGRFSITLQRVDANAGAEPGVTAIGTFVVPVVTLAACPQ